MSQAERRIWLCADDYGISTAVNTAIRDLVVRGRLNATSAMVLAPSFQRSEAAALDVLNSAAPRVATSSAIAAIAFGADTMAMWLMPSINLTSTEGATAWTAATSATSSTFRRTGAR